MSKIRKFRVLAMIYNDLFNRAKAITDTYDACQMDENHICIRNKLLGQMGKVNINYGCCGDPFDRDQPYVCKFLVPGVGCNARCLYCATFLCPEAEDRLPPEALKEMEVIKQLMYALGLARFRRSSIEAIFKATYPENDNDYDLAAAKGKGVYDPNLIDKIAAVVPKTLYKVGKGVLSEVIPDPDFVQQQTVVSAYQQWLTDNPDMTLLTEEEARNRFNQMQIDADTQKLASIVLDIELGDILLGGRYKNKRTVVKKIGKDEYGHPTINGKSLIKFYIEKLLPEERKSKKTRESK